MEVYSTTFLSKVGKKTDTVQRLNQLHDSLSKLSQEPVDRPRHLGAIAAQLISEKFLTNADRDIRILSVACVVDILRVYAPEAPYSDGEMCGIFRAITKEFRGLATCDLLSQSGSMLFYILKSLSVVKSCVVLVYMSQRNVRGATDILVEFFEVLVSSIRAEHSEELQGHVAEVLQVCVEESEGIKPEVLYVLLAALLPNAKAENMAAYRLCQSILRRSTAHVHNAVGAILNKVFIGAAPGFEERLGVELSDYIYPLVYEAHKLANDILLRILPNICIQLQAEDLGVRLKAVKLLGQLFSSPHAEYGSEYARNFRDFLGRFVDVSSEVRLEMVVSGGAILLNKPNLRKAVEECIVKRLRDGEWEIRQAALIQLTEVALVNPLTLQQNTYVEMAERMKDRRPSIRRNAMHYMAKIYARHVSGVLCSIEDLSSLDSAVVGTFGLTADLWASLNIIPSYIISCWGYPEFIDKHLVIQVQYFPCLYSGTKSRFPSFVDHSGISSSKVINYIKF
jgi:sister-chromatid-cohesion protein PDS5